MNPKILIILILLGFTACKQRNKLNSNEQKLAQQIASDEKEKREVEAAFKLNTATIPDTLPPGFRFQEDRSVDPNFPPIVIDFSKEFDTTNMKLSDIASKVEYIRLKIPDDSLFFLLSGFLNFTDDNIILNNNFGVHRFSRRGEYLEPIANSNIQNRILNKKSLFGYFHKESYKGIWGNDVTTAGNRVFYKFSDYPNEKVSLFQHRLKPFEPSIRFENTQESKDDGSFTKGKFITEGKEGIYSGTPGLSSSIIEAVSSNYYAAFSRAFKSSVNGLMMVTFNLNGDTLCEFTQFDTLDTPITSSVLRSVSTISSWHYKGVYTFKRAFNDTIFRLVPPNRLVPTYVLNFGKHKVTAEDWFHVNKSLNGKMMPGSIYETERFLFIEYREYSPTSKKLGDNHYALFNKIKNKLVQLDFSDEFKNKMYHDGRKNSNWFAGFENDIDGGFPFWPRYVTPEGKLAITIKPETLKYLIQRPDFKNRNGDIGRFKAFVQTLTNDERELVIMIIE